MTPEQQYELDSAMSQCQQEIALAEMAIKARALLNLGYAGHGMIEYQIEANRLIHHLRLAITHAEKLPPYHHELTSRIIPARNNPQN